MINLGQPINKERFQSILNRVDSEYDLDDKFFGAIHLAYFKEGGMVQMTYVESGNPFEDPYVAAWAREGKEPDEILALKLKQVLGDVDVSPFDLEVRSFDVEFNNVRNPELCFLRILVDNIRTVQCSNLEDLPDVLSNQLGLSGDDLPVMINCLNELIEGQYEATKSRYVWVRSPSIDKWALVPLSYSGFHEREWSDRKGEVTDEGYQEAGVGIELGAFNGEGFVEVAEWSRGRDCDGSHGRDAGYLLSLDELDQPRPSKQIHRCLNCGEPLNSENYDCRRHDYEQL